MPVYNKRGILLLPKVIVLNPKDGLVNGNQKIQEIAEFLDLTLDTFWYADNTCLSELN